MGNRQRDHVVRCVVFRCSKVEGWPTGQSPEKIEVSEVL